PQRLADISLRQRAAAAQAVEHASKLIGQRFEHGFLQRPKRRCANPRGAAEPPLRAGTGSVLLPGCAGLWERGLGESMGLARPAVDRTPDDAFRDHGNLPRWSLDMAVVKPNRMLRRLFRVPSILYRWNCGWLFGRRFLLLTHIGRRSGS